MRTTITLDDDVAAKLKTQVQKTGKPFKEVVNEALRVGLQPRYSVQIRPVKINARPLGLIPGLNYDSFSELLEQVEGPFHR